jgi:hypothetical protein
MPYKGEYADKSSHSDIVNNPDVLTFLQECDYLKPPSEEEARAMSEHFLEPPYLESVRLPSQVIAIDGSPHESSLNDQIPSTKIGYIKVSAMLIDMAQFGTLRVRSGLVDPFRVAALQKNNSPLTFTLPSANISWRGQIDVRNGFRAALDAQLYHERTRFKESDPKTSLRTTLFHLASRRPGEMGTNSPQTLKLHRCPICKAGPIEVEDRPGPQSCVLCGAEVYPSDCLRLWEEVSEYQSNGAVLNRTMSVIEHLLPIHYIRYLKENALPLLGSLAFFVDGPLAIFGTAAWLHGSIMRFLSEVNGQLARMQLPPVLLIGLQKSGQIVDHVKLIDRFIPPNRLFAIDDEYRYQHIFSGRDPSGNGFGYETYYGQDFIYKTSSGRTFVLGLPYPFEAKKRESAADFNREKVELARYVILPQALALIKHFEIDLYENAVVPVALAHRYTAISLEPGGRVLDLLTRRALTGVKSLGSS